MVEKILTLIKILIWVSVGLALCHRVSYKMKLVLTEAFMKTISSTKTQLSIIELQNYPRDELTSSEQFLLDVTLKLVHPTTLKALILSCSDSVNKYSQGLLRSSILSGIFFIITSIRVFSSGAYTSVINPLITTIVCVILFFKSYRLLKEFYERYGHL